MKSNIWQDNNNWTHIDWELDGVTSKMLNWFRSNMGKWDDLGKTRYLRNWKLGGIFIPSLRDV